MAKLLYFYCEDDNRRKSLEKLCKIKMEESEIKFLKVQQNEIKNCTALILLIEGDKKIWKKD